MLSVLADIADVPADWLKNAVILILALGIFWAAVFRKAIPQPMETRKAADYVPRHEFSELKNEVHAMRDSLTVMKDAILHAGEQRAISIHGRIEPLSACVHELSGEVKQLAVQFHNMNNRLPAGLRKS